MTRYTILVFAYLIFSLCLGCGNLSESQSDERNSDFNKCPIDGDTWLYVGHSQEYPTYFKLSLKIQCYDLKNKNTILELTSQLKNNTNTPIDSIYVSSFSVSEKSLTYWMWLHNDRVNNYFYFPEFSIFDLSNASVGDTLRSGIGFTEKSIGFQSKYILLSTDTSITVQAGKFEKCYHLRRVSERYLYGGTAEYYFAPGVGLIKKIFFTEENETSMSLELMKHTKGDFHFDPINCEVIPNNND